MYFKPTLMFQEGLYYKKKKNLKLEKIRKMWPLSSIGGGG